MKDKINIECLEIAIAMVNYFERKGCKNIDDYLQRIKRNYYKLNSPNYAEFIKD